MQHKLIKQANIISDGFQPEKKQTQQKHAWGTTYPPESCPNEIQHYICVHSNKIHLAQRLLAKTNGEQGQGSTSQSVLENATLAPNQSPELAPHAIRGAAFRALHQWRFKPFRWLYTVQIPRARPKELVMLHLFSGHRRGGDLSTYLEGIPAPDGVVALDIIFDSLRCDLSRQKTQQQWWHPWIWRGATLDEQLEEEQEGTPQTSYGVGTSPSGWTQNEKAHLSAPHCCLLFPRAPDDFWRGLQPRLAYNLGNWALEGPSRSSSDHFTRFEGKFGAKSPKPTMLLEKGLPPLKQHLLNFGTLLPMPKALKMGRTEGTYNYNTAAVKEYPPLLCQSIGSSIGDFVKRLPNYGTSYELHALERHAWVAEVKRNQNLDAQMGLERVIKLCHSIRCTHKRPRRSSTLQATRLKKILPHSFCDQI